VVLREEKEQLHLKVESQEKSKPVPLRNSGISEKASGISFA
jgi:hypothetical protein